MFKNTVLSLFLLFAFFSCEKEEDSTPKQLSNLTKIKVVNGNFTDADNLVFFPWGFNYTNAQEGVGLIDDNWSNEAVWETIESDFLEMKELGANMVRIHLQYNKFMQDAYTPNEVALNKLEDLVDFAGENGIYLSITGLSAYRKDDQPQFYVNMSDSARWETQALFWRSIAKKVGDKPAVFAFNLMNEPVVSVGCTENPDCEWLPGSGFGGFHFVQNITRSEGETYAETIKEWINYLTQSIRSEDEETLITVGFLSLGSYSEFAPDLDYVSPHTYPRSGEIDKAITKVLENQSNVPLVIEETSNLHCSIDELKEFLSGIDGKYQGLMGHYFGTTLDELQENTIIHALRRNFLQFFIDNNPN